MLDFFVMINWIFPAIGAFLIGLSKGGFATGLGMISTPLVATAIPARQALGIILPLLCFADWFTISVYWRKWDLQVAFRLLLGAVPGIISGMFLIGTISDKSLKIGIGVIALIFLCLLIIRQKWFPQKRYIPSLLHSLVVGFIAGFTSTLAHAAGPIIAIFLLAQKFDKQKFVATCAIYFALGNLLKVPPYIISGVLNMDIFLKSLYFLPIIPLGVLAGWWANKHLSQKVFVYIVYVLLFATAIKLIF